MIEDTATASHLEHPISGLTQSLKSLQFAFPITVQTLKSTAESQKKAAIQDWAKSSTSNEIRMVAQTILDVVENPVPNTPVEMNINDGDTFFKSITTFLTVSRAVELIERSFIMTLDSEMDIFIGRLIRALYYVRPHIMKFHGRQVRLGDVIEAKSLENFQNMIVDKEVDSLLRSGRTKQIKWIEDQINVNLSKCLPTWGSFIEMAERRNLFAHHNGLVSQQYLVAAKDHKFDLPPGTELGKPIGMTEEYFEHARSITLQHGLATAYLCWFNVAKDSTHAVSYLRGILKDLTENGDFTEAEALLRTLLDLSEMAKQPASVLDSLQALVTDGVSQSETNV